MPASLCVSLLRILPQGCAVVTWLVLPCLCIPFLPWSATVWTWPLELREGHGGWMRPIILKARNKWLFCPGAPQGPAWFQFLKFHLVLSTTSSSCPSWGVWQGDDIAETWSRPISAKQKLGDRILGEWEKDSFIVLPDRTPLERGGFLVLGVENRATDKDQGRGTLALFLKVGVYGPGTDSRGPPPFRNEECFIQ